MKLICIMIVHKLPLLAMTVSYLYLWWSLYRFVHVSIVRPVMFFCRSDFKSSLVSFIIFFITDLMDNVFSTLVSGCWVFPDDCNNFCSAFRFLYWYWVWSVCLLRFTRCPVPGFAVGCWTARLLSYWVE